MKNNENIAIWTEILEIISSYIKKTSFIILILQN